tara:strand:+ start:307 stop:573 length:267 start_codon:yes stop_codon:yes gene_type:complete
MPDKNKKKNTRSRKGGTKVKVKVKTGSSQKKPSLMQQLLSAGVGGLAGLFANRMMPQQRFTGDINPRIKTLVNDRSGRMDSVNTKTKS